MCIGIPVEDCTLVFRSDYVIWITNKSIYIIFIFGILHMRYSVLRRLLEEY